MKRSVGIIIPCYNGAAFLRETIASTLAQTASPSEVIVVDDGSTDDSATIAESFGEPVRVIRQTNQGESIAMNAAVAASRSDYLVFLGADDVLAPDLLDSQLNALDGALDAVACTGFAFFIGSTDTAFNHHLPTSTSFFPDIIGANIAPASCWMTPRALIVQAGCYHAPQQYFEDWDLWWRIGLSEPRIRPVPTIGFYYRQHPQSQLASLRAAERAYGHAWLMERMCRGLLDYDHLFQQHADRLFWGACTALRASRAHGVSWKRLQLLANLIEEVARRKPASLTPSTFVRLVAQIGFRRAELLHRMRHGNTAPPSYKPAWMQPQTTSGRV